MDFQLTDYIVDGLQLLMDFQLMDFMLTDYMLIDLTKWIQPVFKFIYILCKKKMKSTFLAIEEQLTNYLVCINRVKAT